MENRGFIMSRFYDAKKNKDSNSTLTGLMITSVVILAILVIIYFVTISKDLRYYAKIDPLPKRKDKQ